MNKILLTLVILASTYRNSQALKLEYEEEVEINYMNACETSKDEWKCCVSSPSIQNHTITVCVDVEILRKDMGFRTRVSFNNITIIEEEVSVRNPPPLCEGIPYLQKFAGACIKFYNVTIDFPNKNVSGCVRFYLDLVDYPIIKVPIGCFNFSLSSYDLKLLEKKLGLTSSRGDHSNSKEVKLIV